MSNPTVPFYPMTHDDAQELIAAIGDNSKLAAPYDATRTYAVNEHCIYGGNVQRCKIPINTPEQWTPGHWEQITVGDELTENSQGLAKLIPVITGDYNNSGYTIASGNYFEANGALYLATGSIPTGYPWSSSAQAVSGTAVNALNGKIADITPGTTFTTVLSETYSYTTTNAYLGSFTLSKPSVVIATQNYNQASPKSLSINISNSSTQIGNWRASASQEGINAVVLNCVLPAGTYYLWGSANAAGNNDTAVIACPI